MTPEQYAAAQAVITAKVVSYVGGFGKLFLPFGMSLRDWLGLLELLWPAVKQARDESASLARTFYDSQRDIFHPNVPNLARELEPYEFDWFVQDMAPVKKAMSRENATPAALDQVQLSVARAVENGGRRQIIHAVESDDLLDDVAQPPDPLPDNNKSLSVREIEDWIREQEELYPKVKRPLPGEPKAVRGWARVATGRETCAWCLMLVSRGPVYESARSAGLRMDDEEAADIIVNDKEINSSMNEWHIGCDCKVVPVFSETAWVGREAQQRAEDLWIQAGLRADIELEKNPDKTYYSVKERRWKPTTMNRETINQLRQMIDNGEIKSSDWAALQAA